MNKTPLTYVGGGILCYRKHFEIKYIVKFCETTKSIDDIKVTKADVAALREDMSHTKLVVDALRSDMAILRKGMSKLLDAQNLSVSTERDRLAPLLPLSPQERQARYRDFQQVNDLRGKVEATRSALGRASAAVLRQRKGGSECCTTNRDDLAMERNAQLDQDHVHQLDEEQ